MENFIELKNICKSFGSVHANDMISLTVRKGEILALLGENGSGKSTFVNILAGIYAPDSGTILVDGREKFFSSPKDAIRSGIGMVHQHFKLVNVMSVLDNITLGERHSFFVHRTKIAQKITKLVHDYGFSIDPRKKIYTMSVSEKQTVEIVKMLYQGAQLLILDEPTAVLTPQETEQLFTVLRQLRNRGCSVIIITHKLNEVMEISDRVTVLHKGTLAGTVTTAQTSASELAELMVGGEVSLEIPRTDAVRSEQPLLRVTDLCLKDSNHMPVLDHLSFDLYGGEILGVAGIVGSGQKELCEAIAGLTRVDSGSILFDQDELIGMSPLNIKKKGLRMSFIPEDRLGMGLVAGMDITDNVLLKTYDESSGLFVDRTGGKKRAELIVKNYAIATPGINHVVKKLSGGNIQKVLLGREIELHPRVLVTAYPFRGLDVGASNTIYAMLNEQKCRGVAVLLIGEDLDTLRGLSDRLMVIHNGRVMNIVNPRTTTKENLGIMMMGGTV
jgi:general nucleoside transport system ATP-binding protein